MHLASCIFLALIPLSLFEKVAEVTNEYDYKDFVVKQVAHNRDGDFKQESMLLECEEYTNSKKTPKARHHADTERNKLKATTAYVKSWIVILFLQGALFGTNKPPSCTMWENFPYGLLIPYIQNSMSGGAYEFMWQFIHFSYNR